MARPVSTRAALAAVLLAVLGALGLAAAAPAPATAAPGATVPVIAGDAAGVPAAAPGEHEADVHGDVPVVGQTAGAPRLLDRATPGGDAMLPAVLGAALLALALLAVRRRAGSAVRRPGARVASRAPPRLIAC